MALTTVKSDQIQTSVALAGSPTTTTQSASDNSTKVATTAYVETAVANLVASAPAALNTLDELAAALNDDASFSTTITNSIATKAPLASPTFTGNIVATSSIKLNGQTSSDGLRLDLAGSTDYKIGETSTNDIVSFGAAGGAATHLIHHNISSGHVGIGTASPAALLDVGGGNVADPTIRIDSASGGDPTLIFDASQANRSARIKFYDNGSAVGGFIDYLHNGDKMNFGAGSSATATMTVGDGNVGLGGQTSPQAKLDIKGDTSTYAGMSKIYLTDTSSNAARRNWAIGNGGSAYGNFTIGVSNAADGDPMAVGTHTTPFIITSSGNVLVGTTDAVNTASNLHDGVTIYSDGRTDISRSGGQPINLRRRGGDGVLAAFYKEASGTIANVGSISNNSTNLAIDGTGALELRQGGTTRAYVYSSGLHPWADATYSLGASSVRWSDLYLSGGVFLGGTGSANHLDDYEEGTCSLKWSDGTNESSAITGRYTKIGRQVTVSNYVHGNISSLTSSANILISGFPFPFADYGTFPVVTRNVNAPTGTINLVGFHNNSGQTAQLYFVIDNSNYVQVTVGDMNTGTNDCYFNITYQTS